MICHFWQQGNCQFDDRCRNVHSGPPRQAATGPQHGAFGGAEVCRHFLAGNCRFGDSCRLAHPSGEGGQTHLKGKGKGIGKGGGPKGFKGGGSCKGEDEWKGVGGGQGCGKAAFRNRTLGSKGPGPASASGVSAGFGVTSEKSLTGPYLGKGSELNKLWSMPLDQGHDDSIVAAILMNDRLCTGGLDRRLLVWRGQASSTGVELKQENEVALPAAVSALLYHAESTWFFVGLVDGLIKAFREAPVGEAALPGHTAAVNTMVLHEAVLLSGSEDASVRAWRYDAGSGNFQCLATLKCDAGPVFAMHVHAQAGGFWVGGQTGISCFVLQSMQAAGTIGSASQVVGLVPFEECVIAAYADGVVKVFDASGNEKFSHGPVGEHTTNTAIAIMRHPAGKDMLLCGQELGYVTAYDIPEFRPRGTFCTGFEGDLTAIVDMKGDGLFATCGFSGDVTIWRWEQNGGLM